MKYFYKNLLIFGSGFWGFYFFSLLTKVITFDLWFFILRIIIYLICVSLFTLVEIKVRKL